MTQWLEHVLLFQKGQVPFPAPISGGTQLPIIPVPGDALADALAGLRGHCTHVHKPNTDTYT